MQAKIRIISEYPKELNAFSFSSFLQSYLQTDFTKDTNRLSFLSYIKIENEFYFSESFPKTKPAKEGYSLYEYEYNKQSFSDYENLFRLLIRKSLELYQPAFLKHKWLFLTALREYLSTSKIFENFTYSCKNANDEEKRNFNPGKEIKYFKNILTYIDKKRTIYYLSKWIFLESEQPLNYKSFEQIYFYSCLKKNEVSLALNFNQDQTSLEYFNNWTNQEQENFLILLQNFNASKSLVKEFIDNLHTINKRNKFIANLLKDYENILSNEKTSELKSLREKIKHKRYPAYSKNEKKIKDIINSFEIPDELKNEFTILYPKNLEEDYFQVLLNINDKSILNKFSKYFDSSHFIKQTNKLLKSLEL